MELFPQNSKLKASSNSRYRVHNWGIPAYRAQSGLVTCPMAGACGRTAGCYAMQGSYRYPGTVNAYEGRLAAALAPDFEAVAGAELARLQALAARKGQQLVIRLHDSGDFFSPAYTARWLAIMAAAPGVLFYAYTKMVPLFQQLRAAGKLPSNFTVIFSEGGLADQRIDRATERHSRVFPSLEALKAAGYADATEDDLVAAFGANPRIGLVYHGYANRTWTTDAA